jgi:hypothetical protein
MYGTPEGVAFLMIVPLSIELSLAAPTLVTSVTSNVMFGDGLRNADVLNAVNDCAAAPIDNVLRPTLTLVKIIVTTMSKLKNRLGLLIK